jgi:hypothetical protein
MMESATLGGIQHKLIEALGELAHAGEAGPASRRHGE